MGHDVNRGRCEGLRRELLGLRSPARAVLLRPLPYRDPDRLVIACGDMLKRNVKDFPLSNADFLDIRGQAHTAFQYSAAVQTFRGTLPRLAAGRFIHFGARPLPRSQFRPAASHDHRRCNRRREVLP